MQPGVPVLCESLKSHQGITSEPADSIHRVGIVNTRDAKLYYLQTRYSRATGAHEVRAPFLSVVLS
jgi:hypothetical protein